MKRRFRSLLLAVCCVLAGCGERAELFNGLSEREANDVLAELADQHVEAVKRTDKTGVAILVTAGDITRSVRALNAAGLPRKAYTSIGEIFKKEGIISTPLEERARYVYALSQELESTLSQIDGVVTARVHVVLPERIAPGEPVQPASAAVFLKHTIELDPDSVRARIQQLVASSIPGMAQEAADSKKFTIVFVPATQFHDPRRLVSFGPFFIDSVKVGYWSGILSASLLLLVLAIAGMTLVLKPQWRRSLLRKIPRLNRSTRLNTMPVKVE